MLGCTGADGTPGERGPEGPPGPAGDAGVVPPLQNDVSGTVTDGAKPLTGVSVKAEPGGISTTTDANGAFAFPGLDIGAYTLTFHLDGYLDETIGVAVSLAGPTKVTVVLALDESAVPPPSVAVADQLTAGFAQTVSLKATATGAGPLTYAWTQIAGPAVTLSGADTAAASFTTRDFAASMGSLVADNARFGVLGLAPDQAGGYVFEVTVTDTHGHATKAKVHVDATRPTSGLRMAPTGIPVWLQGDGALVAPMQSTYSWKLDTSGAPGSTATISNPTAQFPSFTPDVMGTYAVTEEVSGKTLDVYAGVWMGEMTAQTQNTCTLCHSNTIAPDMFTPWKKTAHHAALQKAIDGELDASFEEDALPRYTVGYDRTAQNSGFDDAQTTAGWSFPATLQPGNWSALLGTSGLGQLAGIQCESCHGPQGGGATGPHANSTNLDLGARISWSGDVCASCHRGAAEANQAGEWAASKHADLTLAFEDATVEARGTTAAHCGRCHSAQGFAQYVKQLDQGYSGLLTSDGKPAAPGSPSPNAATVASLTKLGLTSAEIQPQTCAACHDPHDATNPSQLRIYDAVASLPNGMTNISGAGTGMICITCHNTRNGEHTDFVAAPTSFSAPHTAAQADAVYGFNAYYVPRYNPSPHLAVANSCAGCHAEATAAKDEGAHRTDHSFKADNTVCATCHGPQVDGVALQAVNQTQIDALGAAIGTKVRNLIVSAQLPANGGAITVRAWDPVSDTYSSTSASNVSITQAPVSVDSFEVHGSVGFILHLPSPITIGLVNASGAASGSITTADVYVQASALKNATAAATLFTASSDYLKASWNLYLLQHDNTKGIHNPSFYAAVLAATNAKVATLP
ncbi:Hypothetical protein A7982_00743 [Minicystis rosea]|nr:Hypothetical protein A7982_00743 [Minicystis rosea]